MPRDLARKLHEPLRAHFASNPAVQVVVEQRDTDRRASTERRTELALRPSGEDRRSVRSERGRRVGDRRSANVSAPTPSLPRIARRHADRLQFIERFEPSAQEAEDIDTARLVTRLQAGDTEAFATLYTRYFDRVYSYVRVVLQDSHEAEDATQQIFVRVFERIAQYEQRAGYPFRAWLFVAVKNYALTHLQKQSRVDVMEPAELDSHRQSAGPLADDRGPLRWLTDRELMIFVNQLPLPQRQVLMLRFMVGLKSREIAEVLGRSPESVRTLQFRALAYLRARLDTIDDRPPTRQRLQLRGIVRKAPVMRARRFALLR